MKATKPVEKRVDKLCSVCGRVLWGNWIRLPADKGRHDECALGSAAWKEHYLALSPSEQEPFREFFNLSYPQEGGCTHELSEHSEHTAG